jgi:hypothetical protein
MTVTSFLFLLYAVIGYFFLITTHFHYSVDVFVGILIASSIFYSYHAILKTLHERRPGWFKSLITWLEHIPKVGEYVLDETEEEQQAQARFQQRHFEAAPAIEGVEGLHTYVVYSLTQNRYILKRVREIKDLAFVNRQERRRVEQQQSTAKASYSTWPSVSRYSSSDSSAFGRSGGRLTKAQLREADEAWAKQDAERQYQSYGVEQSPKSGGVGTDAPFVFRYEDVERKESREEKYDEAQLL